MVLPVSGIAGEAHVQGRRPVRQAQSLARTVDQQQGRGLADPLLDRLEPDQFAVEFGENFADPGVAVIRR